MLPSPSGRDDIENVAKVITAEHRNGSTSTVKLTFDNKTTTFKKLASRVDAI